MIFFLCVFQVLQCASIALKRSVARRSTRYDIRQKMSHLFGERLRSLFLCGFHASVVPFEDPFRTLGDEVPDTC
jgi:hypothetical protein